MALSTQAVDDHRKMTLCCSACGYNQGPGDLCQRSRKRKQRLPEFRPIAENIREGIERFLIDCSTHSMTLRESRANDLKIDWTRSIGRQFQCCLGWRIGPALRLWTAPLLASMKKQVPNLKTWSLLVGRVTGRTCLNCCESLPDAASASRKSWTSCGAACCLIIEYSAVEKGARSGAKRKGQA